jgi:hypothetical protein
MALGLQAHLKLNKTEFGPGGGLSSDTSSRSRATSFSTGSARESDRADHDRWGFIARMIFVQGRILRCVCSRAWEKRVLSGHRSHLTYWVPARERARMGALFMVARRSPYSSDPFFRRAPV